MLKDIVIVQTNASLAAFERRGTRLVSRADFEVSTVVSDFAAPPFLPNVVQAFREWLAPRATLPCHWLVDCAELDFRVDTVPHVYGRDRAAVMSRKLAQTYRTSPMRASLLLGRESEGRRDDRALLFAIASPDLLEPWLTLLRELEVPLAGVYAAPVVFATLHQRLGLTPQPLLIASVQGDALRQSFFNLGELRFSRTARAIAENLADPAAFVQAESMRTAQYLEGNRALLGDASLTVLVIAPNESVANYQVLERLQEPGALEAPPKFTVLSLSEVMRRAGVTLPLDVLAKQQGGARLDHLALLAALFAGAKVDNHFASESDRAYFSLRRAKQLLVGLTAVAATTALGFSGLKLGEALSSGQAADSALAQMAYLDRDRANSVEALKALGVPAAGWAEVAQVAAAIGASPQLRDSAGADWPSTLIQVMQVLQRYPSLHVTGLEWQRISSLTPVQMTKPGELLGVLRQARDANAPVKTWGFEAAKRPVGAAANLSDDQDPSATDPTDPIDSTNLAAQAPPAHLRDPRSDQLSLVFSINDPALSYRAALALAQELRLALVKALAVNRGQTRVVGQVNDAPIDVRPSATIVGALRPNQSPTLPIRHGFKIEIRRLATKGPR